MKKLLPVLLLTAACGSQPADQGTSVEVSDTSTKTAQTQSPAHSTQKAPLSNDRFKDVRVTQNSDGSYVVTGQAQVFEATLSWVLMQEGKEVDHGFATADQGAPAWGNFSFQVMPETGADTRDLNLVIFEESAKDGSRQHILEVPLH